MARPKKQPGVLGKRRAEASAPVSSMPVSGLAYWVWWDRTGGGGAWWTLAEYVRGKWFVVGRREALLSGEVRYWQGPLSRRPDEPPEVEPLSPEKCEIDRLRREADAEDARAARGLN